MVFGLMFISKDPEPVKPLPPPIVYSTLGECCEITVKYRSEYTVSIEYWNSKDNTVLTTIVLPQEIDSVVQQRAYQCEYLHETVPFNYKIK